MYQFKRKFVLSEYQQEKLYCYLFDNVVTASMASEATGIPQKNICRYKRSLERAGKLWEVEKKKCKKTGRKAWYLTTNPGQIRLQRHLRLFN